MSGLKERRAIVGLHRIVQELVSHFATGQPPLSKEDAAGLLCRAEGILESAGINPDRVRPRKEAARG